MKQGKRGAAKVGPFPFGDSATPHILGFRLYEDSLPPSAQPGDAAFWKPMIVEIAYQEGGVSLYRFTYCSYEAFKALHRRAGVKSGRHKYLLDSSYDPERLLARVTEIVEVCAQASDHDAALQRHFEWEYANMK